MVLRVKMQNEMIKEEINVLNVLRTTLLVKFAFKIVCKLKSMVVARVKEGRTYKI